jgi:hypothetical protein
LVRSEKPLNCCLKVGVIEMTIIALLALAALVAGEQPSPGPSKTAAIAPQTKETKQPRRTKDPITAEMREALRRINEVHSGMPQQAIDEAVTAFHAEIARHDPKVFVELAVPHLIRLAPRDTQTRELLRRALANGWLAAHYARGFLVQAGDNPEPHVKALMRELADKDAAVRARAITGLAICGPAAKAALPPLRKIVSDAKAPRDDFRRAYTFTDPAPEHVRAHWAIGAIEKAAQ